MNFCLYVQKSIKTPQNLLVILSVFLLAHRSDLCVRDLNALFINGALQPTSNTKAFWTLVVTEQIPVVYFFSGMLNIQINQVAIFIFNGVLFLIFVSY